MSNSSASSEVYSDEVQEIIDRPPKWIVLWGVTTAFIVFVVILMASWFVKYPDVLHANVIITTLPSPIDLISRKEGHVEILKKEKELVKNGDLIAMVKTNVNLHDLIELEDKLASNSRGYLSVNYQLGDLQHYLSELIHAQQELELFHKTNLHNRQIAQLERQVKYQLMLNTNLEQQLSLMKKEHIFSREKFESDSLLYLQKVLARLDFNSSKTIYLQHQRNLRNAEATMINNQREVAQMEKQMMELDIQRITSENQLKLSFDNRLSELLSEIKKWKETFLFISPMAGQLSYLEFLETGQFVESGKRLFSIVPISDNVFGLAELPINSSGKVKEGQEVNIRLQNYPFEQFGMLHGKVESISLMPSQGKYMLRISLPEGMVSSYRKPIPFQQQLQGDVEIITEDLRLIERLFYQTIKIIRQ